MDNNIQDILKEYIKSVNELCDFLIMKINQSENINLKNKYDFFEFRANHKKMEFEFDNIVFKLHGKGCFAFSKDLFFDWEFGYRSRWCGIDPWKVAMTLKQNNSPYKEYYNGNTVNLLCKKLVNDGILYEKYKQYYFVINEEDTFIPEFPKEYDTLIIEYGESRWSIERNKLIERFIRKSVRIDNMIKYDFDRYILNFYLNAEKVYSIEYNDLRFPESAVKIMTDQIINKL